MIRPPAFPADSSSGCAWHAGWRWNRKLFWGDEPSSALDPISSQHIEKRLLSLKDTDTSIIVTHTLRQAKRLADQVIFMYLGEVVEAGPAQEVINNPRQERTQQYMAGLF